MERARSQKLWGGVSEVTETVGWGMRGHRSCGVGCARSQNLWGRVCEVTEAVGWGM